MKIKSGFMLREVAGQWVIIPLGTRVVEFNAIMTLSESGAILWNLMENGTDEDGMTEAILAEYDVDEMTARKDVCSFINDVKNRGLCEID